jgi:hypothetical protein
MPSVNFDDMPDHARVWIFAADRAMNDAEKNAVGDTVDGFLEGWAAHGTPLTNARDLKYDQFLMIAVDESAAGASGCSIDAMVHRLKALEETLGLKLIDHSAVQFRASEEIRRVVRPEFAGLAEAGEVDASTTVFNNTVGTVGDVRAGRWETPAAESWHAQAFF